MMYYCRGCIFLILLLFLFESKSAAFLFEVASKVIAQKFVRVVFNFRDFYNEFGAVQLCLWMLLFQMKFKLILPRYVESVCFLFVGFNLKFFSSVEVRAV